MKKKTMVSIVASSQKWENTMITPFISNQISIQLRKVTS